MIYRYFVQSLQKDQTSDRFHCPQFSYSAKYWMWIFTDGSQKSLTTHSVVWSWLMVWWCSCCPFLVLRASVFWQHLYIIKCWPYTLRSVLSAVSLNICWKSRFMFIRKPLLTQHRLSSGNETACRTAEEAVFAPPQNELHLHPRISHESMQNCSVVGLSTAWGLKGCQLNHLTSVGWFQWEIHNMVLFKPFVLKDERVGCGSGDVSRALAALWAGTSRQAVYPWSTGGFLGGQEADRLWAVCKW